MGRMRWSPGGGRLTWDVRLVTRPYERAARDAIGTIAQMVPTRGFCPRDGLSFSYEVRPDWETADPIVTFEWTTPEEEPGDVCEIDAGPEHERLHKAWVREHAKRLAQIIRSARLRDLVRLKRQGKG